MQINYFINEKPIVNFIKKAIPLIFLNLLIVFYNITDYYWLGHIDDVSQISFLINGIGSVSILIYLGQNVISLIKSTIEIFLPKFIKSNKNKEFAFNMFIASLIVAFSYCFLIYMFLPCVLNGLNLKNESYIYGQTYLQTMLPGLFLILVNSCLSSIVLSYGKTIYIFLINATGVFINLILDPILIKDYNLMAFGAGLSTFLANIIPFILLFIIVYKLKIFKNKQINLKFLKEIKISLPIVINGIGYSLTLLIINNLIINQGGDLANSIKLIGGNVESISWLVFGTGLSSLVCVFVSQNEEYDRIRNKDLIKKLFLILSIIGIIIGVTFYNGGEYIYSLLSNNQEIINGGNNYLKILAISQAFMCYEGIIIGILNGYKKTTLSSLISIFGNFLLILLLVIIHVQKIEEIWIILCVLNIIRCLFAFCCLIYYNKKTKINKI